MRLFTALALGLCAAITAAAQIPLPRPPLPRDLPLPNIDRFLRGESPISTSLKDARMEAPWLDRLEVRFGDLATQRNARGSFTLTPGHWQADLHSFCFRPGTRGPRPTDGRGYVSAPITGPQGQIFGDMLTKYALQRDVSQQDMQILIWALLSRTKIRNMNAHMQSIAVKVLTPAQMAALDSGALDVVPPNLRQRAFGALPPEVRAIAEAENRIRDTLYRANHTYAELERIAVIQGPEPRVGRDIPRQRWSVHPHGYLIRYLPHGFSRTTVQIARPPKVRIQRDGKGRIVAIDYGDGRRTETEYDDAIPVFDPPGNLMTVGYAFKTVRLIRPGANGRPRELVVRNTGWTFVLKRNARLAPRFEFARFRQDPGWAERFAGWKERYEFWRDEVQGRIDAYREHWERNTEPPPDAEEATRDLEDSEHYHDGIEVAITGDTGDRLEWIADHHERQNAALESATILIATLPDGSDDGLYATPPDVAVPGSAGAQRLGISPRGF